ncbi:hypothetical protein Gpo141_00006901 [Globisporangium polare]
MDASGVVGTNMGVSAAMAVAHAHTHAQMQQQQSLAHVQAQVQAQVHQHVFANDVHTNGAGGDIDSLLSSSSEPTPQAPQMPQGDEKLRRVHETYESHRAHVLRAECYHRGIRPIKKGPHANDNKNGYIVLLRKFDGTVGANGNNSHSSSMMSSVRDEDFDKRHGDEGDDDGGGGGAESGEEHLPSLAKKRKLQQSGQQLMQQQQQQSSGVSTPTSMLVPNGSGGNNNSMSALAGGSTAGGVADFGFYENGQPTLVPVLPMQQYTAMGGGKPTNSSSGAGATTTPANTTTTDLEILSGIANTYTQNTAAAGDVQLCGSCRMVVNDQLMESIRLGKSKMQLHEQHRLMDQRDRDTLHLKEVLQVLIDLRRSYRDAQSDGVNHELLSELEDDIAFFLALKERTKERMRLAMQERERTAGKAANSSSS